MLAGIFDTFFGIPTHPFAVHAPVVLVPIGAVVAVVLAVKSGWRNRLGWWAVVGVLGLVAMLFFAKESGEALEASGDVLGDVDEHTELGETTFIMSLVWLGITAAMALRDRQVRARSGRSLSSGAGAADRDVAATLLSALFAIAAVVTTIWLVRTGHAGSTSRWVG